MPKIETPHQLLVHLVCIDDKHWPHCRKTGDYSERDAEKEALIASRDAQIRQEDAERAVAYCGSNRLTEGWQDELRAKIIGKEGEK